MFNQKDARCRLSCSVSLASCVNQTSVRWSPIQQASIIVYLALPALGPNFACKKVACNGHLLVNPVQASAEAGLGADTDRMDGEATTTPDARFDFDRRRPGRLRERSLSRSRPAAAASTSASIQALLATAGCLLTFRLPAHIFLPCGAVRSE
jgi:hypothetical protein